MLGLKLDLEEAQTVIQTTQKATPFFLSKSQIKPPLSREETWVIIICIHI